MSRAGVINEYFVDLDDEKRLYCLMKEATKRFSKKGKNMAIVRPTILIQSPQGFPIAVVEVKNRQNLYRDVATDLRRNLVNYGVPSQVPYFMLLSQDVGFLWKGSKSENLDEPPAYEFPMDKVVKRYLELEDNRRIYGVVLELLVQQWLNELTISTSSQVPTEEPEKTLALSGFNESIKGATVLTEEDLLLYT